MSSETDNNIYRFQYGELNDVTPPEGPLFRKSSGRESGLGILGRSVQENHRPDPYEGTQEWYGVVLRIETAPDEDLTEDDFVAWEKLHRKYTDNPDLVRIKVRIPELHATIPEPRNLSADPESLTIEDQLSIDRHPTFVSEMVGMQIPNVGDIVKVFYDRQSGQAIYLDRVMGTGVAATSGIYGVAGSTAFAAGSGVPGMISFATPPGVTGEIRTDLGAGATVEGQLGCAPYRDGTIQIQSIWTAHITETSAKDDPTFENGACPGALTGYYKDLTRFNTSFLKYNEQDVVAGLRALGYDEFVKITAFAYMRKEQPPRSGQYSFPNNNVAGIQTDGSQQAGLTTEYVDFQTCYQDAETWRAFAGFITLDRGLDAFLRTVATRYQTEWAGKEPTGTLDQITTQLADNYYQGWNVRATDEELATMKETGSFTRGSSTYTRNWAAAKSAFETSYNLYQQGGTVTS
jgi:hypothetical protein